MGLHENLVEKEADLNCGFLSENTSDDIWRRESDSSNDILLLNISF